jgi:hypothetical protein
MVPLMIKYNFDCSKLFIMITTEKNKHPALPWGKTLLQNEGFKKLLSNFIKIS